VVAMLSKSEILLPAAKSEGKNAVQLIFQIYFLMNEFDTLTIKSPYVQELSEIIGISFTTFSNDIVRRTLLTIGSPSIDGMLDPCLEAHFR
jgi:uncharacterized membrane protein YagU involved in acid resistance